MSVEIHKYIYTLEPLKWWEGRSLVLHVLQAAKNTHWFWMIWTLLHACIQVAFTDFTNLKERERRKRKKKNMHCLEPVAKSTISKYNVQCYIGWQISDNRAMNAGHMQPWHQFQSKHISLNDLQETHPLTLTFDAHSLRVHFNMLHAQAWAYTELCSCDWNGKTVEYLHHFVANRGQEVFWIIFNPLWHIVFDWSLWVLRCIHFQPVEGAQVDTYYAVIRCSLRSWYSTGVYMLPRIAGIWRRQPNGDGLWNPRHVADGSGKTFGGRLSASVLVSFGGLV